MGGNDTDDDPGGPAPNLGAPNLDDGDGSGAAGGSGDRHHAVPTLAINMPLISLSWPGMPSLVMQAPCGPSACEQEHSGARS